MLILKHRHDFSTACNSLVCSNKGVLEDELLSVLESCNISLKNPLIYCNKMYAV